MHIMIGFQEIMLEEPYLRRPALPRSPRAGAF
jgi:hypothetical protein